MKRFFTCAGISVMLLLSACSADIMGSKNNIDRPFSAEARIAVGGETVCGQLSRSAENCWTLSVSEPYALDGLTVTFEDGETTFSMLGYECTTDFSDSASSALKLIAAAYESAVDNSGGFTDGVLEQSNENGSFSVTLDENGMPAVIKTGGVTVQLSQWSENADGGESDELILLE